MKSIGIRQKIMRSSIVGTKFGEAAGFANVLTNNGAEQRGFQKRKTTFLNYLSLNEINHTRFGVYFVSNQPLDRRNFSSSS